MTFFDVYGPYDLESNGRSVPRRQSELWVTVANVNEELEGAIGCYMFGLRFRDKIKPWYVGMTVAKGGFRAEVLEPHKIGVYKDVMEYAPGQPVIFFFPLITESARFSRGYRSSQRVISWLERTLMALAYNQNPDIGNIRDMKYVREVEVRGLIGARKPGRPFHDSIEARKALMGR